LHVLDIHAFLRSFSIYIVNMSLEFEDFEWGTRLHAALHESRLLLSQIKSQNMLYCDTLLSPHATSTLAWRSGRASEKIHEGEFSSLSPIKTNPKRNIKQTSTSRSQIQEQQTPIYQPGPGASQPFTGKCQRKALFIEPEAHNDGTATDKGKSPSSHLPKSTVELRATIKRLRRERENNQEDQSSLRIDGDKALHHMAPLTVETPQQSAPSKNSFPSLTSAWVEGHRHRLVDASTQASFDERAAPRQLALVASLAAATAFGLCQAGH
jgi:hypothetical protein